MTRGKILLVCAVLAAFAAAPSAQSKQKAAPDPVSGTWTGELAREGADRPIRVTFQLTLDGKGAIAGTMSGMPSPADVKSGTFDSNTGALMLQVGKVGEPAVLLTLRGTVSKGAAKGKFSGEDRGEFTLAKAPSKG